MKKYIVLCFISLCFSATCFAGDQEDHLNIDIDCSQADSQDDETDWALSLICDQNQNDILLREFQKCYTNMVYDSKTDKVVCQSSLNKEKPNYEQYENDRLRKLGNSFTERSKDLLGIPIIIKGVTKPTDNSPYIEFETELNLNPNSEKSIKFKIPLCAFFICDK